MIVYKLVAGIEFSYIDVFFNLLGLQGICATDFGGVYWSLAYEIWFYVMIAAVIALMSKRIVIFSFGCLLALLVGFVFMTLPIRWFLVLLLGMLMYFLRGFKLSRMAVILCVLAIVVFHALCLLSGESHAFQLPFSNVLNPDYPAWMLNFMVALILFSYCYTKPQGAFWQRVEGIGNRWAPMTYSLYITHFTVLEFYKYFFGQFYEINLLTLSVFILVCMICLLVGFLFYRFIEEPLGHSLKKHWLH